ncbi:hypothetical protein GQ42DRAFT_139692 [Ramicandelaber brevisporus]|nr:hypothetical protein GQ42DRAFT_139692 [Ramicandelaber brevisporus]
MKLLLPSSPSTTAIAIHSAVLHLRGGTSPHPQPFFDQRSSSCLAWNGELFGGEPMVPNDSNDGELLFERLISNEGSSVLDVMDKTRGPFAMVYWDAPSQQLWFGRDRLGRRSLVLGWDAASRCLVISSNTVASSSDNHIQWIELPADGMYCLDSNLLSSDGMHLNMEQLLELDSIPATSATLLDQAVIPMTIQDQSLPLYNAMYSSVKTRIESIPPNPHGPDAPRVGILFSGGIDCAVLALLADRIVPANEPIELFNVAFSNPNKSQQQPDRRFAVPDRVTGLNMLADLRRISPQRDWRFVSVDVELDEAKEWRNHIIQLMAPHDTAMDLSIALALWFAARGRGTLTDGSAYIGQARVLLLGMGADEQFGGYSRHREAYRQGKWLRLLQELQLDVSRISSRNLGRDDRIISDHAKEARFPFLDEDLVRFISNLPVNAKMDVRFGRGIGEKLLLRYMAVRELGMSVECASVAKRAIQFGARTAKLDGAKEVGTDRVSLSYSFIQSEPMMS